MMSRKPTNPLLTQTPLLWFSVSFPLNSATMNRGECADKDLATLCSLPPLTWTLSPFLQDLSPQILALWQELLSFTMRNALDDAGMSWSPLLASWSSFFPFQLHPLCRYDDTRYSITLWVRRSSLLSCQVKGILFLMATHFTRQTSNTTHLICFTMHALLAEWKAKKIESKRVKEDTLGEKSERKKKIKTGSTRKGEKGE